MSKKHAPLYEVREIRDLKDMLAQSVEIYGGETAFLTKPVTGQPYVPVTYRQYSDDVARLGMALLGLGLRRGSSVAILAETRYEWYVSYLAITNGEAVVVPLDKELQAEETRGLLSRAHCAALICSRPQYEKVRPILDGLEELRLVILMDGIDEPKEGEEAPARQQLLAYDDVLQRGQAALDAGDRSFLDAEIDPEEMRILLFTSGTTDLAKGVMHNHRSICINLMAMCQMTYVGHPDVALSVLPLHHTYECTCGFLCQIYRGNAIAQLEGLRHITKNLEESGTTLILVVPLIMEAFHKRIWSAIRKDPKQEKKVRFALKLSRGLRRVGIDVRRKLLPRSTRAWRQSAPAHLGRRAGGPRHPARHGGLRLHLHPGLWPDGMRPDPRTQPRHLQQVRVGRPAPARRRGQGPRSR